jgi:hypothetical protein
MYEAEIRYDEARHNKTAVGNAEEDSMEYKKMNKME